MKMKERGRRNNDGKREKDGNTVVSHTPDACALTK